MTKLSRQIVRLHLSGLPVQAIAEALSIRPKTALAILNLYSPSITTTEAARIIGRSHSRINQRIVEGSLKATSTKPNMISKHDVELLLYKHDKL